MIRLVFVRHAWTSELMAFIPQVLFTRVLNRWTTSRGGFLCWADFIHNNGWVNFMSCRENFECWPHQTKKDTSVTDKVLSNFPTSGRARCKRKPKIFVKLGHSKSRIRSIYRLYPSTPVFSQLGHLCGPTPSVVLIDVSHYYHLHASPSTERPNLARTFELAFSARKAVASGQERIDWKEETRYPLLRSWPREFLDPRGNGQISQHQGYIRINASTNTSNASIWWTLP